MPPLLPRRHRKPKAICAARFTRMNPLTQVKRIQKINSTEAALGISEGASWHAKYKDSAYVFVGGIPYDLTEGDLLTIFAPNLSNPKIRGAIVFHEQGPQTFDYSIRLNHTWAFSGFPDVKTIMDVNGLNLNDLELGLNIIPTLQYGSSGFFTIDVDIGSSSIAKSIMGLVLGYITYIVVDLAILIEATEENELSEYILGTVRLSHVNLDSAVTLRLEWTA